MGILKERRERERERERERQRERQSESERERTKNTQCHIHSSASRFFCKVNIARLRHYDEMCLTYMRKCPILDTVSHVHSTLDSTEVI